MLSFRLVSLAGSLLFAAQVYAGFTTCIPGTFDQYLVIGTVCQTGDLTFRNFQFSSSDPNLRASDIHINALSNGGFYFPISINIASPLDGSDAKMTFTIGYEVTTPIDKQVLSEGMDFAGGGFHNGTANLVASYCMGQPVGGCPMDQGGQVILDPSAAVGSLTFPSGAQDLFVTLQGNLDTGQQGSAFFTQVENTMQVGGVVTEAASSLPEPRAAYLTLAGLAILLIARKWAH